MRATVDLPELHDGRSDPRETVKLVNRIRARANWTYRARFSLTTAAVGSAQAIWVSDDVPEGSVWEVTASIVGMATAGGGARCRYVLAGLFYREPAGALTQEGATTLVVSIESVGAFDSSLGTLGNSVVAAVTDDGVRTMNWLCRIEAVEVM